MENLGEFKARLRNHKYCKEHHIRCAICNTHKGLHLYNPDIPENGVICNRCHGILGSINYSKILLQNMLQFVEKVS